MRISIQLFVVLGLVVGCGTDEPDVLSYEQFKAQAYLEPDTGVYVIDGDHPIATEEEMGLAYDAFLRSVSDARLRDEGYAVVEQGLAIYNLNGQDVRWTTSQAQNLTYCVDKKSFGTRHAAMVTAMESATGAWEAAANVNFIHDASQDAKCSSRNNNVVFNVRQVTTTQYLARAFFPNATRRSREILVSSSSFGNISPWTLAGVCRHELGHTLGFRHEHTRPEAGTCFEDNNWRALTAYDASSVMHYPQCNGTQNGDLVLTNADKAGAASVY